MKKKKKKAGVVRPARGNIRQGLRGAGWQVGLS
ncbi:hypothetical protein FOQG_00099 [Fusarium oxysporum f. sp. raphani 54005]|uniref:Uncharacterized protein n=4 Tax=Fusarium oxysporum TaxID=5507 RepID=X0CYP3_FUSOX|nr:hypothetical protein FOVG_03471 [Fusarium oxysporum f. sp. pisi HDV247]EXK99640.1 hypothetical protein FOQG_00099 [Fusarium oxysporum f. sp. raphani 54005]EXL79207.1 hypothetical protein FOPG_06743 [Fusarium oxysporum f. sp. conglutinans race 2 54008]EXM35639.1 hypothetical protein FOTG_00087 [Fusarium oxysporum f. sp. vasinfectum 25433]KAI8414530.1 hypothetical protein FOFC_04142 [Fusarium oxysporum]